MGDAAPPLELSDFRGTGRDVDRGYADFMKIGEAFAHPIPAALADAVAAPLPRTSTP